MRSAIRLVWVLGVRHLTAHRTRLALSALGVATGVALAVAVSSLSSSITASLRAVARAAASEANLEVRPNAQGGLPPELVGEIADLDGVEEAGATVESFTRIRRGDRSERVLVIGVDRGVVEMAPEAVDPSTLEDADPFGLMLPAPVASDLGVGTGDEIEVATPGGWRPIDVGAVLTQEAAERGRIAVGLIGVVQNVLGRGDTVDAIYVDATEPDATLPRVQEVVGTVGRAGPIALRTERIGQLLQGATTSLNAAVVVALFVGGFLVYNTMAMAAVERIGEAAVMRAVGARRRQVFGLFLAEGGLLGVVGSGLGLVGGVLLARLLLTQRGGPLAETYPIDVTTLSIEPAVLAGAGLAGVAAAVAAAYLPARRVAYADVAPALGPVGALEDPTATRVHVTATLSAILLAAGVPVSVIGFLRDRTGVALVGFTLILGGIAFGIRTAIPTIARWTIGRLAHRGGGLVRLAAGEILRSPGRTAFTVGAVLLALSLVVGFTILQASFSRTFEVEISKILRADLYVRSATWRPLGSDVPLDESLATELREVPGVDLAFPFRVLLGGVRDTTVVILSYDTAAYARLPQLSAESRDRYRRQARELADQRAVVVSNSALGAFDIEVGDTIDLPTPTGTHALRIVGADPDPSAVTPQLVMDYATYTELWGAGGADSFEIGLAPGADPAAVRERILERFGPRYGVEVDTTEQFQDRINAVVRNTLGLISSVQLVAVIVAALGLANTLLISTLERRRDLGVLRAVGMLRRQVRRMVVIEAVLIGGLGVVLAWGLGTAIGLAMREVTAAELGMEIALVLPAWGYGIAAVIGLGAAAIAAVYPAHRASTVDVVDALTYE